MSGTSYLLDTNVVLGCLGGHEAICSAIEHAESSGASFAISVVTRMELLSFPDLTPSETAAIEEFLSSIDVVALTEDVERRAVSIRRETRAKLPDAIIVATAMEAGCVLLTCDRELARLTLPGLSVEDPSA